MKKSITQKIWKWMPKKSMSRVVGRFAKHPISRRVIPVYIKMYDIDLSIVKRPLSEYENLLDFFIRELKPEARPIAVDPQVVISPVDGTISQAGMIDQGTLIQAKGVSYSLSELLGENDTYMEKFNGGKFVTIYLSPRDYHRIHMPVSGWIEELTYIPGELYPVNELGVRIFPGLFARNERVISYIQSSCGQMALVKVGATNVGSIKVVFDEKIITNPRNRQLENHKKYSESYHFQKGDEVGRFEFGSTVILLFEPNQIEWTIEAVSGTKVVMGQSIARVCTTEGD
ncbi:archaetidylserine decarboxylase [Hazenella coriacea]|uniref:Phosphatidylserine decarboxylase proenzyme n=1 Tax=Hazenella coriacea TaxID=1179467 RepID=A0A4R3L9N0_9BACL|nr:archaetidylserine decarboxylase [Hazenella coriacea]TCS94934.1 phosphatidylserine decarboxylase [Hazenella coriacea]